MKVYSNLETAQGIKEIIAAQTEHPDNVRLYISGMG